MFLAACVQLRCTTQTTANLDRAESLIRRAASRGATFVATPENTPFLGSQFHSVAQAQPLNGPIPTRFAALAAELQIHLLLGSFAEVHSAQKCFNTSLLFGPDGTRLAAYRKMHLFDVNVPGGLTIRESDNIVSGDAPVTVTTALGTVGMSICYDLRFPELYRMLVDQGAQIITVPSAFTLTTGKDHWHALLRARAIETQSWIIAPGQWGTHDEAGKRRSYGHSLIIDPWGTVVADKGQGEGICFAEIDLARVAATRAAIPVQTHRRLG